MAAHIFEGVGPVVTHLVPLRQTIESLETLLTGETKERSLKFCLNFCERYAKVMSEIGRARQEYMNTPQAGLYVEMKQENFETHLQKKSTELADYELEEADSLRRLAISAFENLYKVNVKFDRDSALGKAFVESHSMIDDLKHLRNWTECKVNGEAARSWRSNLKAMASLPVYHQDVTRHYLSFSKERHWGSSPVDKFGWLIIRAIVLQLDLASRFFLEDEMKTKDGNRALKRLSLPPCRTPHGPLMTNPNVRYNCLPTSQRCKR
eukprot:GHVN01105270.1.p1 GENE.GHVN01105270.1~~GHVN01105270.1.p1  ORF type:complete len:265 (-),score=40.39 GHVN01105270.1:23-817(-)